MSRSGPALPRTKFIVAINWTGITFLDDREKRLLELSFPEVTGVHTVRSEEEEEELYMFTVRKSY